jgi:hypothetical protein
MTIQNVELFKAGLLFLAAGLYLTVFYKPLMQYLAGRAQKNIAAGKPAREVKIVVWRVWLFRAIGGLSLVMAALGLWLGLGGTLPDFTG